MLSTESDITKIQLWLRNQYNLKLVKKQAHKWILYRRKKACNQSVLSSSDCKQTSVDPLLNNMNINKITDSPSTSNLSIQEWRIIKCKGDGNCLFRAISNQVFGRQSLHNKVRKEIIQFLQ